MIGYRHLEPLPEPSILQSPTKCWHTKAQPSTSLLVPNCQPKASPCSSQEEAVRGSAGRRRGTTPRQARLGSPSRTPREASSRQGSLHRDQVPGCRDIRHLQRRHQEERRGRGLFPICRQWEDPRSYSRCGSGRTQGDHRGCRRRGVPRGHPDQPSRLAKGGAGFPPPRSAGCGRRR